MRYRALDAAGDYQVGRTGIFLTNSVQVVVQAIKTRLALWSGEWFLDDREGTPYATEILGAGTYSTRDIAVKERVLETPGVLEIVEYLSSLDGRRFVVSMRVSTIYGISTLTVQV